MTVSIGMDQVRHHIVALAVDVLLAWMMKMELLEYYVLSPTVSVLPGA